MFTYSAFRHEYTKSAFCYEEGLSADYTVTVNGVLVPVYTCRISKYPFNRVWTGFQRQGDQSELASFVNLVSDEPLQVTVQVHRPYTRAMLKPYSKEIALNEEAGCVSFTLADAGQFVFEADSYHHCLYIFNSRPIPAPRESEVTHYFGPGVHFPGKITLHSNESLYLDKDALVFGCVYADGAENIRIFGNGMLDDMSEGRCCIHCYENYTNGNMKFYDCRNIRIEGVLMRDSAIWCLNLFHCFDVVADGIKIFGQWRYNTDGIDIVNSQNITIKNSFIHSFDDTVTVKGIERYAETNNENILIEGCVLWCDWGKTCELGIETYCREYKNITFRNCDILRAGDIAMCVDNGETAEMSNITFEDIRVEYNSFDTKSQYQDSDDTVYEKQNVIAIPILLCITNSRWRTQQNADAWGVACSYSTALDTAGIECAGIHDVTCRAIRVYYDAGIPLTNEGKYDLPICISSSVEGVRFRNVTISDITVNGERMSPSDLTLSIRDTDGFSID